MINSPKSRVFNYLSKPQKANIIRYLTQLARKLELSQVNRAVDRWLEEERFLCGQGTSYKPWLAEHLEDHRLAKDAKEFLSFQIQYKASQRMPQEIKNKLKTEQKSRRKAIKLARWEKLPATPKQKEAVKAIIKLAGKEIDLNQLTKAQAYTLIQQQKEAGTKLYWQKSSEES